MRMGLLMARVGFLLSSLATAVLFQATAPQRLEKPAKKPVVDTYHGVEVRDDYRWLEDTNAPATREWVKRQNRYTRAVLDGLPGRDEIRSRLRAIAKTQSPRYERLQSAAGRLFALRDDSLIVLPSVDEPGAARVLV